MKKYLKGFVLLSCSLLLLFGCGKKEEEKESNKNNPITFGTVADNPHDEGLYDFDSASFTVSYPKRWGEPIDPSQGFEGFLILAPNGSNTVNFLREKMQLSLTLEQYLNLSITNLKTQLMMDEDSFEQRDGIYAGRNAKTIIYVADLNGVTSKFMQVVVMGDDKDAFVFTYRSTVELFDDFYNEVLTIFNSFKIK